MPSGVFKSSTSKIPFKIFGRNLRRSSACHVPFLGNTMRDNRSFFNGNSRSDESVTWADLSDLVCGGFLCCSVPFAPLLPVVLCRLVLVCKYYNTFYPTVKPCMKNAMIMVMKNMQNGNATSNPFSLVTN